MRKLYTILIICILLFITAVANSIPSGRMKGGGIHASINAASIAPDSIEAADSIETTDSTAITARNDEETADTLAVDSIIIQTVQQRIEKLLDTDMFKTSQLGLMAYDLTADSVIIAINERQLLRPASTMKLLTAITALDRLGGAYRYSTSLKYKGAQYGNVLIGDLTVVGGMDPRFGTDDLNAFIESVQKMKIDTIYGKVLEDRSFKDNDLLGEGWCWDDKNPVLTPMLWNRKDALLTKFNDALQNACITVLPADSIPVDSLGNRLYITQTDSHGTLCTRHHTLDQILIKMMKDSDNLYAETMFYQIAAASKVKGAKAKHAADIMKQLIKKVGMNPARYRIADGSGLSLYNYQTAELQIKLLRYAFRNPNIYEHLYPSLPIAGRDGTLKKRMHKTLAEGNVHAKTGTVAGVSSLSGYLTAKNGNVICFAIINQGIMHTDNGRNFQNKVCKILCDYEKTPDNPENPETPKIPE